MSLDWGSKDLSTPPTPVLSDAVTQGQSINSLDPSLSVRVHQEFRFSSYSFEHQDKVIEGLC